MLMLQNVQFAAPGTQPVRTPPAVETVAAVPTAPEGGRARNDQPRDSGAEAERLARAAKARVPDPSAPVGPPPAFQANVLESERARLREVERLDTDEARRTRAPDPSEAPELAVAAPAEIAEPRETRVEKRIEASETRQDVRSEATEARDDRAEAREAPAPTRSAYGGVKEDPPRMLDVSR
jgi:hypothetical protein